LITILKNLLNAVLHNMIVLRFVTWIKKGNVRGKCFIEYIPAEKAWAPIKAAGYMYIDCLWVSGQFKGQGNSNLLLDACIRDSKKRKKRIQ
jgi:hypothetical protein